MRSFAVRASLQNQLVLILVSKMWFLFREILKIGLHSTNSKITSKPVTTHRHVFVITAGLISSQTLSVKINIHFLY